MPSFVCCLRTYRTRVRASEHKVWNYMLWIFDKVGISSRPGCQHERCYGLLVGGVAGKDGAGFAAGAGARLLAG